MNIAEILKNVPRGTKLYSPAFGEVTFMNVCSDFINTKDTNKIERAFYSNGNFYKEGECMLFPSRENRDWNTFKKFDINTLKPFDKVLVKDTDDSHWKAGLYSNYVSNNVEFPYECVGNFYTYCIPYNDETKHLIGKISDCPEYYKTW